MQPQDHLDITLRGEDLHLSIRFLWLGWLFLGRRRDISLLAEEEWDGSLLERKTQEIRLKNLVYIARISTRGRNLFLLSKIFQLETR